MDLDPVTLPTRKRPRVRLAAVIAAGVFSGFVGGGLGVSLVLAVLHAIGRL